MRFHAIERIFCCGCGTAIERRRSCTTLSLHAPFEASDMRLALVACDIGGRGGGNGGGGGGGGGGGIEAIEGFAVAFKTRRQRSTSLYKKAFFFPLYYRIPQCCTAPKLQ